MDVKIIFISLCIVNFYLGIFTYYIKTVDSKFKNFGRWVTVNFLIASGYVVSVLLAEFANWLLLLSPSLLVFSLTVRTYGFTKLFNIAVADVYYYVATAFFVLFFGFSFYFTSFLHGTFVLNSILAIALSIGAAWVGVFIQKHKSPEYKQIYDIASFVYFLFSFTLISSLVAYLLVPSIRSLFSNLSFIKVVLAFNLLIDLTWSILFFFVCIQRIAKRQVESDEKYRILAENTSDGILTFGANLTIQYISPAYLTQLGYTADEVIKPNSEHKYWAVHPDESNNLRTEILQTIQSKKTNMFYTYRVKHKEGHYIWREDHAKFSYDKAGNYTGAYVVCRDITDKKEALDQIKKISIAIEQSPSSILITDAKGAIEYVNPKFLELTGYTLQEVLGKNPRFFKSGKTNPEVYKDLWTTIKAGKNWRGEFINRKKNRQEFIERALIAPIFDDDREVAGYMAIKEDITTYREHEAIIEAQIKQLADLNATKDKFLSIIAHDLKNPFNLIFGFSEVLLRNFDKYDKKRSVQLIQAIYSSSKNAYQLLEGLLEWSQAQTGKIEFISKEFGLEGLIIETFRLSQNMAKAKNISISYEVPKGLRVLADRNMIHTVLRNLLSNAIKFTPKNGTIDINVVVQSDSKIEITISDSGIGMDENTKSKLFKINEKVSRLGTEEEAGTGLGLLLCKEFVEKHNCILWVESEEGKGSDFKFTLPLAAASESV